MVCLSRSYPFKFFKGCLPQVLLGLFLNTLSKLLILCLLRLVMYHLWLKLVIRSVAATSGKFQSPVCLSSANSLFKLGMKKIAFYTDFNVELTEWGYIIWSYILDAKENHADILSYKTNIFSLNITSYNLLENSFTYAQSNFKIFWRYVLFLSVLREETHVWKALRVNLFNFPMKSKES